MIHTHDDFNGRPLHPLPGAEAFAAQDLAVLLPQIERTFAEHDAQIRELQQALVEMADAREEGHGAQPLFHPAGALEERIAQLENRLAEQDRMIRHTLTMLIEWIETQGSQPERRR